MSPASLVVMLLGLGTLVALWRGLKRLRERPEAAGTRTKSAAILLLLAQPLLAGLLYLALFPPATPRAAGALVLLTEGASAAQLARHNQDAPVLALPEAPLLAGATRVPDLATALRQHPGSTRLRVLGWGLPERDQEAARGLALAFDATPLPASLVELQAPREVPAGARWRVSGRVAGLAAARVALYDPAGQRVAGMPLDRDGRFHLDGQVRGPGRVLFTLKVLDAKAAVHESVDLPLQVLGGAPLRLLVLAGGPDPELKYLRRWAQDAGLSLRSRISLGAGISIGDAPEFSPETLRSTDVLVLDERAWRGLGAQRRGELRAALHAGLGVLLRITGPLSEAERRELRAWGYVLQDADPGRSVSLPPDSFEVGPSAHGNAGDDAAVPAVSLSRRPLRVQADDGVALLRDDQGAALGLWRSAGRGRLGLWWLSDSHALVLAGHAAAHGQLWSDALSTLARAQGRTPPEWLDADPRPQQRLRWCGLSAKARVLTPAAERMKLLVDAATGCAGYWPERDGWHALEDGGHSWSFAVRPAEQAPGLQALARREATLQRVSDAGKPLAEATAATPGSPWPWFLSWLALAALLWWLERRLLRVAVPPG